MSTQRPNFLLISTDQQRADHLGCYGANLLKTPNIDALALHGTRYENAYVASPVCMPNRASLVTGRMPSLHGVRHNGLNLELGTLTFAEALRRAGWRTSLSGKPHFQCVTQNPARLGNRSGEEPVIEARCRKNGRYDQEIGQLWHDCPERSLQLPYYGFESVDLAVGHGDQVDGHYTGWLRAQGVSPSELRGPENALAGSPRQTIQAWRTAVPEELYPTSYIHRATIDHLRSYAQTPGTPFFHWASFCDPHHPFTPPGKYWDLYKPQDVELPASFNAAPGSEFVRTLMRMRQNGQANLAGTSAIAVSEDELRAALALTYGMIAMIDDAVGEIMSSLGSLGLADNTIVIFLSDHGDLMGEHGLMFKGPYHYRGMTRIPLIWSDPRSPRGAVVTAPVSTIDLAATILETAAVPPFNGLQGRPFKDRAGADTATRNSVLIEDEIQSEVAGHDVRGRVRTLLSEGWRLTIYDGLNHGELYNLNHDPHELENLWTQPHAAARRAEMTEQLLREMIFHSETSPLPVYAA
uniref:sulfatase family protein n=1 Tax=Pararhizobium sp. IMCC3301 TaxID=3067904 RepID=UPI0027422C90|nr:sulfatase-like hydrolase/transferase [Pararhizobium sp. IMCC3301]